VARACGGEGILEVRGRGRGGLDGLMGGELKGKSSSYSKGSKPNIPILHILTTDAPFSDRAKSVIAEGSGRGRKTGSTTVRRRNESRSQLEKPYNAVLYYQIDIN
jgi:hypothetical protein